ncbi:MAG: hypothetical protein HY326_06470 [Chloroflexi bacterium]|nr:hypothetical protein [Chloroflexota bacterium]
MRGLILLVWTVIYLGGLGYLALRYLAEHAYPPGWALFLAFLLVGLGYTWSMGVIVRPRQTDGKAQPESPEEQESLEEQES